MHAKEGRPGRTKLSPAAKKVSAIGHKGGVHMARRADEAVVIRSEDLRDLARNRLTDESVGRLRILRGTLAPTKDRKISARVSGDLLAAVKERLGGVSDAEAIEMALVTLAETDDFGSWMEANAGRLDEDFDLDQL